MLNLIRSVGESILIDNDITITVYSIKGKQVKFGINAPKDINIVREELIYTEEEVQERRAKIRGKSKKGTGLYGTNKY
jgi:carbon storage regulator